MPAGKPANARKTIKKALSKMRHVLHAQRKDSSVAMLVRRATAVAMFRRARDARNTKIRMTRGASVALQQVIWTLMSRVLEATATVGVVTRGWRATATQVKVAAQLAHIPGGAGRVRSMRTTDAIEQLMQAAGTRRDKGAALTPSAAAASAIKDDEDM
jgi:hypothetical protein